MFTGIITHLGKLTKINQNRFTFSADSSLTKKITEGASISVNGVCLTVEDFTKNEFTVSAMPETLKRSALGSLRTNDLVNLELPMTPENFLAGHIVQGHVDATGTLSGIKPDANSRLLTVKIPSSLSKYIVEKGSICLNGISLTIINCNKTSFTVGIIPYTWEHTMLRTSKVGDSLNIETDILAKYVEKLLTK